MTDRCAVEAAELPPPLPPELRRAESRPQLGVMLLRDGHLTMEQLEAALAEKESRGARLGEILVEHGWVTGAVVAQALAEQHGLEFLDLVHVDVDPSALSLLPEKLARRYEALPIRFLDEATVLIAVADPTNVVASDDLRLALGLNVRLAVAAGPDLQRTLGRVYHVQVPVEEAPEAAPAEEARSLVEDVREGAATSAPAIKLVELAARARDRGRRVRHPLRAAGRAGSSSAPGSTASRGGSPRCRSGLQPAVIEPPQDHGRARHRRAAHARRTGASRSASAGSPMDLRIAVLPTTYGEKVALRILHRASGRARPPRARPEPDRRGGLHACRQPAVRRRDRLRADRQRQDDHPLRGARLPERRGPRADDDRGPGRVPDPRRQPGRGEHALGPHVRARPAHDPPLRPRRPPRRRDPGRGDGAHRDPGGDDGPPRAHVAPHAQRGELDRPAEGHGSRAGPARDLAQLHRRAAARPPALPRVPRAVRTGRGRARRDGHAGGTGARRSTAAAAAPTALGPGTPAASPCTR